MDYSLTIYYSNQALNKHLKMQKPSLIQQSSRDYKEIFQHFIIKDIHFEKYLLIYDSQFSVVSV
jgi:hypothetical protein